MSGRSANGEGSVYRRKDGRWVGAALLVTTEGSRRRVSVYGKTRQEAREQLTLLLAQNQRGHTIANHSWRLGEYLDYWLRDVVRLCLSLNTYRLYEAQVRLYLKPDLGTRPINRLSPRELQLYFSDQLQRGRSTRTVQKQRTALSSALHSAVNEGLVDTNAAHDVRLPQWRRKQFKPWSVLEVTRFLEAARLHRLYAAFLMLPLYGFRIGELLGLQWADLDGPSDTLHVGGQLQRGEQSLVRTVTKTEAGERTLPLLPVVRRELKIWRAAQASELQASTAANAADLIFTTPLGTPIEPGNFRRSFYAMCRREGLRQITLHQLRHTTATLLKNIGVPARDAQLILGHANITTTMQLYQHGDLRGQRSGLERLAEQVAIGAGRSRCCQTLLSDAPAGADSTRSIVPNSGGSSQTRTGDTRLFRQIQHPYSSDATSVLVVALNRLRLLLIGRVAVKDCCQTAGAVSLGELLIVRKHLPALTSPRDYFAPFGDDPSPGKAT